MHRRLLKHTVNIVSILLKISAYNYYARYLIFLQILQESCSQLQKYHIWIPALNLEDLLCISTGVTEQILSLYIVCSLETTGSEKVIKGMAR